MVKVERISANEIERRAQSVIEHLCPINLSFPRPTPLLEIIDVVRDRYGMEVDLRAELNIVPSGGRSRYKILGLFRRDPLSIQIDGGLEVGTPRFNFTLAHELGHFHLHRKIDPRSIQTFPGDTKKNLVTGAKKLISDLDWVEWQANHYASALLLPKPAFETALSTCQRDMGISRRGFVHVDNNRYSVHDFSQTVNTLAARFAVSRSVVEFRLNELGLLRDDRLKGVSHVSQIGHISDLFRKAG